MPLSGLNEKIRWLLNICVTYCWCVTAFYLLWLKWLFPSSSVDLPGRRKFIGLIKNNLKMCRVRSENQEQRVCKHSVASVRTKSKWQTKILFIAQNLWFFFSFFNNFMLQNSCWNEMLKMKFMMQWKENASLDMYNIPKMQTRKQVK